MKRVTSAVVFTSVLMCFTLACQAPLARSRDAFVGNWHAGSSANGLTAIRIDQKADRLTARIWASCKPADCDWGEQSLSLLGPLGSPDIDRGLGVWEAAFATRYLTFSVDRRELVVELQTIYKDQSGRSNFHAVERFVRQTP
jgi:hypothetical protein